MCRASVPLKPAAVEQLRTSSSGRSMPRGRRGERGGQGSRDQQRLHARVGQSQPAVAAGDGAQLADPVAVAGVHFELGEHGLGDGRRAGLPCSARGGKWSSGHNRAGGRGGAWTTRRLRRGR